GIRLFHVTGVQTCALPILFAFFGLFLLLFFPVSLAAQEVPPAVGLRPDAPTYALHGPYWVGTQEFVLEGEDNPSEIRVWYPALKDRTRVVEGASAGRGRVR